MQTKQLPDERVDIKKDHLQEPMYLSYAREFRSSERLEQIHRKNKFFDRINHFLIYYLGAYCLDLDLAPETNEYVKIEAPPSGAKSDERDIQTRKVVPTRGCFGGLSSKLGWLQQSEWKRGLRFAWIPHVICGLFIALSAYLLTITYHQYLYDFDLLRLLKMRRRNLRLSGDIEVLAIELAPEDLAKSRVLEIAARIDERRTVLEFLGPQFSHLTILAECFYLIIVSLCLTIYLSLYWHFHFQSHFNYHIVKDQMDRQRERANIMRMLELQVSQFAESSRVYHENVSDSDTLDSRTRTQEHGVITTESAGITYRIMLREMLSSGSLMPLFELPTWLKRRALLQINYHLWLAIYALVFNISFVIAFMSLAQGSQLTLATNNASGVTANSPSCYLHYLILIACLGVLAIAGPSAVLHGAIFVVSVLEQINYIEQLRRMIKQCIALNSQVFKSSSLMHQRQEPIEIFRAQLPTGDRISQALKYLDGSLDDYELSEVVETSTPKRHGLTWQEWRTMNANLIFVLLHYKIFVAQLMPIKRSLGFVNNIAFVILFTVPIIARIHVPYMGQLNDGRFSNTEIKMFAIGWSSTVLLPANLASGPLCYMFARCKGLYKDLASLMAHITEVRSHHSGQNIYDNYAVSCLSKELSDSQRLLDRLTVRSIGITGTYSFLVRAHFWYGLIAISIMTDSNSNPDRNNNIHDQELLSWLFSDPLGVYTKIES